MTRSQRSLVARCKPSTPFAAPDHRKAGLFEAIANVVGGIGVVLDHETLHVQRLPSKSIRQSRAGTPLNATALRSWRQEPQKHHGYLARRGPGSGRFRPDKELGSDLSAAA